MTNETFRKLLNEMCGSYGIRHDGCPLDEPRKRAGGSCKEYIDEHGPAVRDIVKGWALERGLLPDKHGDTPETRREILQAAESCVCGGRELDHGTPEQSFHAIALHFTAFLEAKGLLKEGARIDAADAAAMLALFKVARVAAGNFVADSYVDACGYLACSGELASEREKEGNV